MTDFDGANAFAPIDVESKSNPSFSPSAERDSNDEDVIAMPEVQRGAWHCVPAIGASGAAGYMHMPCLSPVMMLFNLAVTRLHNEQSRL